MEIIVTSFMDNPWEPFKSFLPFFCWSRTRPSTRSSILKGCPHPRPDARSNLEKILWRHMLDTKHFIYFLLKNRDSFEQRSFEGHPITKNHILITWWRRWSRHWSRHEIDIAVGPVAAPEGRILTSYSWSK